MEILSLLGTLYSIAIFVVYIYGAQNEAYMMG